MKKLALLLIVIVACVTVFTACSDTIVPGSAWADVEVLTYDAYKISDTELSTELFTLTTKMENLKKGAYALSSAPDTKYELGLSARRYTVEAKTDDGTIVMQSESLMDSFTSIASQKSVNYNGVNYSYTTSYADKYVSYTLTENGTTVNDSIKVGTSYVDNELLYAYIRTFSNAESGLNSSVTVLDVRGQASLTLNLQTLTTGKTTLKKYEAEANKEVPSARVQILRSEIPTGYPIYVDYSLSTGDNALVLNSEVSNSASKRIPLQIIENDIVYYLKSVAV